MQSDGLSISSGKCCQPTPLARSTGETLIPALLAHPSAEGGRSRPCSCCRDDRVLLPLGCTALRPQWEPSAGTTEASVTPRCHLLPPRAASLAHSACRRAGWSCWSHRAPVVLPGKAADASSAPSPPAHPLPPALLEAPKSPPESWLRGKKLLSANNTILVVPPQFQRVPVAAGAIPQPVQLQAPAGFFVPVSK